tara:strand:+ start:235 stop:489 length:255 start_codon:yes stop_codon:yes gene_type:complete
MELPLRSRLVLKGTMGGKRLTQFRCSTFPGGPKQCTGSQFPTTIGYQHKRIQAYIGFQHLQIGNDERDAIISGLQLLSSLIVYI